MMVALLKPDLLFDFDLKKLSAEGRAKWPRSKTGLPRYPRLRFNDDVMIRLNVSDDWKPGVIIKVRGLMYKVAFHVSETLDFYWFHDDDDYLIKLAD